ncbi:hypothetical protein ES705_27294 [subsurface metagenome]
MFPEGIRIDTEKRQYLTLKVNSLFVAKRLLTKNTEGVKEELPTENGEESVVVAGGNVVRPDSIGALEFGL